MKKIKTLVVGTISTNTYILSCEKSRQAIIIDPADVDKSITNYIQQEKLLPKYCVLTHGHYDHLGGVAWLKSMYNLQILMHHADLPLIENAHKFTNPLGLPSPEFFQPDKFINELDEITIGSFQLKILHTPGHSPGSITLIDNEDAFVGDTLFAQSIGRTDLPGGNYDAIINSIQEKIFTHDDSITVYPGHGPPTSIGIEKISNPFFV